MEKQNDKYIIDNDKLSLLRIKLILECSDITHHIGTYTDINDLNIGDFIKNFKSSYLLSDNLTILKENNKELHLYEYDEFSKSFIVKEIERLLKNEIDAITNIKKEFFTEQELKYANDVLGCIQVNKEKTIGGK